MMWLLLATGFTGAYTLLFVGRVLHRRFASPASVAVRFSPKGGCTEAVVQELHGARREILVLAYSFTSQPIAQALVDAKLRGVHVDIVLDHSNEKEEHTDLHFFLEQGLVPLIDPKHAIAHNKVMIVDGRTIVTGSFNFTNQAEHENAENLLIIKGHPDIVNSYRKDFAGHKSHARPAEVKQAEAKARSAAAAAPSAPSAPPSHPAHAVHPHRQAA
jgi:phosphatidylserine/phosphatidylglycerophosphate/cardiolipin synthase-like enzyme